MQTADEIFELYREHTQGNEPSDELVAQLLALLEPGEAVLFTCGWADMSEKWGPLAQRTDAVPLRQPALRLLSS